MVEPSDPPRPLPDRRPLDALAAWWAWVGPARLVATSLCIAAVAAGGWWLVRAPAPSTEATLPMASSSATSTPASTLPVPGTTSPAAGADDLPIDVVVHVAGRVERPGVYTFDRAPRVHDAIERAGGASTGADLDALNLAQQLSDGQRLYVPSVGEVERGDLVAPHPPTGTAAVIDGDDDGAAAGPIDVNRATADELERLPGIGPAIAAAIVDERERNGPFVAVDDLDRVAGIGPAKLAALRGLVAV
jgi:competence protein ComEA